MDTNKLAEEGEGAEQDQKQRNDRFQYTVYFVVGISLLVLILSKSVWITSLVAQELMLTFMCYGYAFYVEEGRQLKSPWFWKAVLVTIPLHFVLMCGLFWWNKTFPSSATKLAVSLPVLIVVGWAEVLIMRQIISRFRPLWEIEGRRGDFLGSPHP